MKKSVTENEKKVFRLALRKAFKEPVELKINDNAHVFFNINFRKKKWIVRIHWMFLKASDLEEMATHIVRYTLRRNKKSSKIIDLFIEKHWDWVQHKMPPIITRGSYFDLKKIKEDLNRRYLGGKVDSLITWSRLTFKRFREQVQMGSYSTSRNLITVRPRLDQKFVPQYVVEATVFHEMCHALVPVRRVNGRRQIHPPAFKRLEEKYPHLEEAKKWEDKNLTLLLRKPRKKVAPKRKKR